MAIDDLLDEHEQGERVRAWLRNNALGIVGGVALGIALIYGWRWWQDQQGQQQQKAHTAYAQAVEQLEAGAVDKAGALLAGQEGAYATLAALRVAKAQVEAGKAEDAITTLRGIKADPSLQATYLKNMPMSWEHLLGTNAIGQDIFWFLVFAIRNSLILGVLVGIGVTIISTAVGLSAGYIGGNYERVVMLVVDSFITIPLLPILIILGAVIRGNSSFLTVGLIIVVFGWAWGMIGLLLAVPLLVCIKLVLARLDGMQGWARLLE